LAKKKAEEEANSKPKFLTKEERAAEAIRKRQEQVDAQRKAQEEERKKRMEFFQAAKETNKEMERERDHPYQRGLDRDRERDRDCSDQEKVKEINETERDKGKDMEAIKDRYLGMSKKKRRVRRLNERKFVFEWDATEDTVVGYNRKIIFH
jgi:ATP-dependent RNA helicase DDX23/PRP28